MRLKSLVRIQDGPPDTKKGNLFRIPLKCFTDALYLPAARCYQALPLFVRTGFGDQVFLHRVLQILWLKRLGDVAVSAHLLGQHLVKLMAHPSEHHHRNIGCLRVFLEVGARGPKAASLLFPP